MALRINNRERDRLIRNAQMLEAFKVYRAASLLEFLDQPKTFAFFDGLVVQSHAKVVSADPYGLVLQVERAQLAALERTRSILLESPLHGATYRASVDEVDHRKAYVSLSNLEAFDAYHERRAHSRAVPAIPLLARARGYGEEATGRVSDLSTHSLAVDFNPGSFTRVAQAPLLRLDVWGEPGTKSPLPDFEVTASVGRSADGEDGNMACHAVLAFVPYPALERALRRYVARRQRDILTELRIAGDILTELRIAGDSSGGGQAGAGDPDKPVIPE